MKQGRILAKTQQPKYRVTPMFPIQWELYFVRIVSYSLRLDVDGRDALASKFESRIYRNTSVIISPNTKESHVHDNDSDT